MISLGMNPEWTELSAIMEIIKNRFSIALRKGQRHFRVEEKELIMKYIIGLL